ncbi:meiosis-specific protein MEI4 isoform X2 [Ascaphus truei]|uniref:meiosis-specific protein MEI4 isoform X2 n=1 Tax=Ascaphus truei TaxID=8439 RepID=UPI003F5A97E0
MEMQTWYQRTSKLALAIAIIRSKPKGKSSREYTEQLAKLVSSQDFNWKSKVRVLEAEVLRLRQQLLLHNIHARSRLQNEITATTGLASEQQEHTDDLERMSQLEEDSGCDVEDGMGEFVVSQSLTQSEQSSSNFPYFASLSNHLPVTNYPVGKETLSGQTAFLQHLLGLRKLTTTGSLLTDFTQFGNDCSVVSDSVSGLLDGLLSLYRNPKPSVSTFQTEAIGTLTSLLSDFNLSKYVLENCLKNFEDFEKNLIQCILSNNNINRFQIQQSMAKCLILLGRCRILRGPLIHLLFSEVKHFVDELLLHHQRPVGLGVRGCP